MTIGTPLERSVGQRAAACGARPLVQRVDDRVELAVQLLDAVDRGVDELERGGIAASARARPGRWRREWRGRSSSGATATPPSYAWAVDQDGASCTDQCADSWCGICSSPSCRRSSPWRCSGGHERAGRSAPRVRCGLVAWLLFLPNAPYVLTDVKHMVESLHAESLLRALVSRDRRRTRSSSLWVCCRTSLHCTCSADSSTPPSIAAARSADTPRGARHVRCGDVHRAL